MDERNISSKAIRTRHHRRGGIGTAIMGAWLEKCSKPLRTASAQWE